MTLADLLRMSQAERNELILDYARMNDAERLDIHGKQTKLLRKRREELRGLDQTVAVYSMLLLALWERRRLLEAPTKKTALAPEAAAEIGRLRHLSLVRKKTKREGEVAKKIRVQWREEIRKLREKNQSWREISNYIAKWHKKKVSHTYLKNVYERLEAERLAREKFLETED